MTPSDQMSTSADAISSGDLDLCLYRLTFASILFARKHFGCCIACRPAEGFHESSLLELPPKAKVCYFDVAAFIEQHILQLEVSMNHALPMDVAYAKTELTEHPPCFVFAQPALLY